MYVLLKDGQVDKYPYSVGQLKSDNRQTSFPETITDELMVSFGAYPVMPTERPQVDPATQDTVEDMPVNVGGQWRQTWKVVNLPPEQVQFKTDQMAEQVRAQRNYLLQQCDWTQAKDIPEETSAPWAVYRQELRDVPQQAGFPWEVTWPVEP